LAAVTTERTAFRGVLKVTPLLKLRNKYQVILKIPRRQ